jgi:hypothetical protein
MSYLISITKKKDTDFIKESKIVLESNQYSCINENTYLGTKPSSTVVSLLRNLPVYKTDSTKCSINIYHGNASKI